MVTQDGIGCGLRGKEEAYRHSLDTRVHPKGAVQSSDGLYVRRGASQRANLPPSLPLLLLAPARPALDTAYFSSRTTQTPREAVTAVITVITAITTDWPTSGTHTHVESGAGPPRALDALRGLPSRVQAGRNFAVEAGEYNLSKLRFIQAKRNGELDNPRGK